MDQPRSFGQFLLFQQSESNTYRSCYRAGLARGRAIERIIRLEVFDQPDIDAEQLLDSLDSSVDLQKKLKGPHIAAGAGIGHVGGIPYTAYDFELGITLSTFLSAARRQSFPVPFDQALYVAERIALALAAAHQVEHNDGQVLHSFLTPDSVLLSNEGEVKVSGFEVGPILRNQLAGRPFCEPYMSPKRRAGQGPLDQDDVFSLGSILFELVTGEPLSIESIDLDNLIVQATGEPAPESLRLLLEGSFAPSASRIPDVMAWQLRLGRLILDGGYNPTTFNLAFLMHTLLRDKLERGVAELKQEKRCLLPQPSARELTSEVTAEISAALSPPPGEVESPGQEPATSDHGQRTASGIEVSPSALAAQGDSAGSSSADRKPFWLGFSISAVTTSVVLGTFLAFGSSTKETSLSPLAAPANAATQFPQAQHSPASPPLPTSNDAEIAPTPAQPASLVLSEVVNGELGRPLDVEEIRRVKAKHAEEIELSLKAEYEQQLESLRNQITDSQQRELTTEEDTAPIENPTDPEMGGDNAIVAETAGLETTPAQVVSSTVPAVHDARFQPSPSRVAPGMIARTEASEPEAPPSTAARAVPATAAIETEPPEPLTAVAQPDRFEEPGSETESSTALPAQVPTPARLIRLTPPTYPTAARRLGLSATALVKVLISPQGKVKEAEIVGPPLGSGFDGAALAAVRRSRWTPATENGEPVESWNAVTIEFQP